jgi:ubiquinone/menaquinone biosynthesis C-methylase UbiE
MPKGAKETASDVYILDVGESGAARLRLLDQVYGASTRKMLLECGVREGSQVLDLACGIGAVSCWLASQVVAKWHCAKCEPAGNAVASDARD